MPHVTLPILLLTADYFVSRLDNGAVRVGMFEVACIDFPADHPEHRNALALTAETVEAFFDSQIECGRVVF